MKGIGAAGLAGLVPTVSATGQADDRYIVDTGDEVSEIDRIRADQTDLTVVHDLENCGFMVVEGSEDDAGKIGEYNPDIELEVTYNVEFPDGMEPESVPEDPPSLEEAREQLPDDADSPTTDGHTSSGLPFPEAYEWDVDTLDLDEVHSINTGTDATGDPVRVGIIDDGVYRHGDLNVVDGVNLTGDGEDPYHPNAGHYHGTHVAGITAGNETGVAPDAELVSLRYFSTAGSFFGDFMSAIEAAIVTDCDVVNASLGFGTDQNEDRTYLLGYIQDYIDNLADVADEYGIVWVASAGNSANNANDLVPGSAKAEKVVSVSSTGPTGMARPDGSGGTIYGDPYKPSTTPSSFTTNGEDYVDVSAPGGSWDVYPGPTFINPDGTLNVSEIREHLAPDAVLSTFPADSLLFSLAFGFPLPAYAIPDTSGSINYAFLQGTSMSAPQVAGAAALLSAEHPDWSAHEIREVLKATAQDLGDQTYHGHGFVDIAAALQVDDPAEIRGEKKNPDSDSRDDRGRNEAGGGGSPRNGENGGEDDDGRGRGDTGDDDGEGRSR